MDWHVMVVTIAFILLDLTSGFAQAIKNKRLNSSKMRDGLWHKAGFIGVIVLAYLCECAVMYIDLGFSAPLVAPTCTFICLTELVSVFENLCKLSPELANSKLAQLFNVDVK